MVDVLIVGGGMAGMTSALYARRNNKSVLIIEKEAFGGQIAQSPKVENFPTIPSISGLELSEKLFSQISDQGVDFEVDEVKSISKKDGIFTLTCEYGTYSGKSVIIACGVKHKTLSIEGIDKFLGKGVHYCAVCDGPFYKDKEVVLVGDGNTALQYALLLSDYCSKVTVCTMFDRFFGDQNHVLALNKRDNVEVIHDIVSVGVEGEECLTAVEFKHMKSGESIVIPTNALFVAIGQVPDNTPFASLCDLDKKGYIISDEGCRTKTDGLFVAGDCRTKSIRQLTTAASDGAVSALSAVDYLSKV